MMLRGLLLTLAMLCCGPSLLAHQLRYSLTDLTWLPDSGSLQVVHSIHLDDAVELLARLGAADGNLDSAAQARAMLYVEKHFSLRLADEPLELEPVGAQIDGDYLWLYQEMLMPGYPEGLQVHCSILQDLFEDQQNQVNLRVGDDVRTLRFDRKHDNDAFSSAN